MNAIRAWFVINGKHMLDALMLLAFTIVGSTLPLWGGALIVRLFSSQWPSWSSFCFSGEFAIYSAALLAPVFYIITKDYRRTLRSGMQLLICIFFLASAILFAGAKSGELLSIELDKYFLKDITLKLFAISAIIYYLVHVLDYVRVDADIQKARQKALESLEKDFDRTGRA